MKLYRLETEGGAVLCEWNPATWKTPFAARRAAIAAARHYQEAGWTVILHLGDAGTRRYSAELAGNHWPYLALGDCGHWVHIQSGGLCRACYDGGKGRAKQKAAVGAANYRRSKLYRRRERRRLKRNAHA